MTPGKTSKIDMPECGTTTTFTLDRIVGGTAYVTDGMNTKQHAPLAMLVELERMGRAVEVNWN
jgi:hypothetical protein